MKIRHILSLAAAAVLMLMLSSCTMTAEATFREQTVSPTPASTPAPEITVTPAPTVEEVLAGMEDLPPEPASLSERRGYTLLPHSAWKKIEEVCYILNPTAGATTGSATIYSLPGYDYTISMDEVLRKGTSGGFCCAGYISWLFYNVLDNNGYHDRVSKLTQPGRGQYTYKSVRFFCYGNKGYAREIRIEDAVLGDLILFGGMKTDHQHMGMYAGRNKAGQVMIWHSGQDGVGRMRADRVRTNGTYNYIAGVYNYFEPPADISATVWKGNAVKSERFTVLGPYGYSSEIISDKNGNLKLTGLDLGRYVFTDSNGERYIIDLDENGTNAAIMLK